MKTLARLLVALTATLLPAAASAQTSASANLQTSNGLRVACFSPQRAFSESADGQAILARLATLEAEKARVIDEKNKALQAPERALEQTSPLVFNVDDGPVTWFDTSLDITSDIVKQLALK